jgi:hypothetical protein
MREWPNPRPDHFGFASAVRLPVSETTRTAEFPIISLAARRKGIAHCAALHLDCARFTDGRSVSVAFEEQLLIPQQHCYDKLPILRRVL